jgi:hypothetical protein
MMMIVSHNVITQFTDSLYAVYLTKYSQDLVSVEDPMQQQVTGNVYVHLRCNTHKLV